MPRPEDIRIAFLVDDFNNEYSIGVAEGAFQAAREAGISLVAFGVGALGNPVLYHGMRNLLFSVIPFEDFDGVIYQASSLANYIGDEIFLDFTRQYQQKPSAFLGLAVDGHKSFTIDNFNGMYDLVTHIIKEHGRRKIAFIGGAPGVHDADERLEAYKQALADNDIPFDNRYVYDGDFNRESGILGIEYFIDGRKIEFDAVVGANDFMALYAMKELHKRGFKIPEDVCIGGFDDLASARSYQPRLTTVHHPVGELGYRGTLEFAKDLIKGEVIPNHISLKTTIVTGKSCGCEKSKETLPKKGSSYTPRPVMTHSEREELDAVLRTATRNIIGSFEESDIREVLDESFRIFNIERFCIAEFIDSKNSVVFYDTKDTRGTIFPTRSLIPGKMDSLPTPFYKYVMALFYREEDIGFFISDAVKNPPHIQEVLRDHISGAIKGARLLKEAREYSDTLEKRISERTSELAERSRQLEKALNEVKEAGRKLEEMATIDELTGLYNRRGFMSVAGQNLELMRRKKSDILIVFLDLDGLKLINDNYGHAAGDRAIKALGEILIKSFRKSDIIARLGGDEFTVLAVDCTIKRYGDIMKRMNKYIDQYNLEENEKFTLSVSSGAAPTKSILDHTLEELMHEADCELYKNKREKKKIKELNNESSI